MTRLEFAARLLKAISNPREVRAVVDLFDQAEEAWGRRIDRLQARATVCAREAAVERSRRATAERHFRRTMLEWRIER